MGALDDGHFDRELENGVKLGFGEESLEDVTATIEDAVKVLLQGLGEDSDREGLKKTPIRVAKALTEGTRGYRQNVKDIVQGALFPEAGLDGGIGCAGGVGGLVVVRDISLFSYCESCLLPFKVECHIGYVPSKQRVVGLSKLSRAADVFARRLQEPQRLADEVCSALQNGIKPAGVAVALQCWHIQFPAAEKRSNHAFCNPTRLEMRGWALTSVSSGSGVFEKKNNSVWDEFLTLSQLRGVSMEKNSMSSSSSPYWCPSRTLDKRNPLNCKISSKPEAIQLPMISAVASIIYSLGEDLLRKELVGTPYRFLEWFMNFKRFNSETKLPNGLDLGKMSSLNLNGHIKARGNLVDRDRNGIRCELNLPFWSQCEHHLLPFHGTAHVGYFYVEEGEAIQRSVLQSIVQFYSCNLQVQERLTRQIAETVSSVFRTSVMVVVEASHICMMSRGIEKVESSTATIAMVGQFSTDPVAKAMFLQSVSNSGDHRPITPMHATTEDMVGNDAWRLYQYVSQHFIGTES